MKILDEILKLQNNEQAANLMKFFKTESGQYAEGDKFLGIKVPQTRELVKKYSEQLSIAEVLELLRNEYHEVRLFALLTLVKMYENQLFDRNEIFKTYISNTKYINNWDLVDLTAPKIVGRHCFLTKDNSQIKALSDSMHLWSERISIVSQLYPIKQGDFYLTLELCEKFLTHKHDLIHKACGWLLREIGKQDESILCDFLEKFHNKMPRTMLRYSLEKLTAEQKTKYM